MPKPRLPRVTTSVTQFTKAKRQRQARARHLLKQGYSNTDIKIKTGLSFTEVTRLRREVGAIAIPGMTLIKLKPDKKPIERILGKRFA